MSGHVTEQEHATRAPTTLWRRGLTIWSGRTSYVLMYLGAIVVANLLTAWLGPLMTMINAFLFIGLDLRVRDNLHDAWYRRGLWWKMAALIATGSAISWVLNRNAGQIAFASFVAFAVSSTVDALVYGAMFKQDKMRRVNGSNLAGAMVDSLVFPALAFGWPPDAWIVYGQFTAKVAGGLFWSLVLR